MADSETAASAADRLARYRAIRDFTGTPEPSGAGSVAAGNARRFVVQEHHATSLHWDLRLERDGALASWAVPKGIPPDPKTNHLAVRTEDHPLEYLTFEAVIPDGHYGAGEMTIWDTGTYDVEEWTDREVKAVFHGQRVQGRYVLFRTRGNQWMIHRMDPPADPDRRPWPGWAEFEPMLAAEGPMPSEHDAFGFEIAWGGRRTMIYVEGGRVRVRDGDNGAIISTAVPELRALGLALGTVEVLLDGELIVPGGDGRPDEARLARRLGVKTDSAARRQAQTGPAVFMIFDVLWLEGHPTGEHPYAKRRELLESLRLGGPSWQVSASHVGDGPALLAAAEAQGLPGVVAKALTSPYRPGPAPGEWVFVATGG